MKRLNKITLILVAVMGIMISGCGGDIEKAPYVISEAINNKGNIVIEFDSPCMNENIYNTDKAFRECHENVWEKMRSDLIIKNLKGRRDCGDLPVKAEDCPPMDRLNGGYTFTLKTKFGTFKYNTGDESTRIDYYGYAPIK